MVSLLNSSGLALEFVGTCKVLHVMHYDKFNEDYIEFCNSEFDSSDHLFVVFGGVNQDFLIGPRKNVIISTLQFASLEDAFLALDYFCSCSKRIFLHGLFFDPVIKFFEKNNFYLGKCYWVVWGGDLYPPKSERLLAYWERMLGARRRVVSKIRAVVVVNNGDYCRAVADLGFSGECIYSILYPSNVFIRKERRTLKNDGATKILIGNSASHDNNHKEAFKAVSKKVPASYLVYCPLSYGDRSYADDVISLGKEFFGSRFVPLTDYVRREQYFDTIANMDIAVFSHDRQQAVSNIVNLLGCGKKVYLKSSVSTYKHYMKLGVKIFNIDEFSSDRCFSERERNMELIEKYQGPSSLLESWAMLFDI